MLKIIIIQGKGNVARSPIILNGEFRGLVEGLPGKLRISIEGALDTMKNRYSASVLEYNKKDEWSFKKSGVRYTSGFWQPQGIDLLAWYIRPHIVEMEPGKLDGKIICNECKAEQLMNLGGKCGNSDCSSHEKWAEVDSTYTKPDPFKRAFAGLNIGAAAVDRF